MEYSAKIIGDQRVALRFDEFPQMAHDGLAAKIRQLTDDLSSRIEALVPRGKTGALEASVTSGVEVKADRIRGWVSLAGADAALVKRATALEFGSTGAPFQVRGYHRELDQAFGRMTAPFDQVVAAYQRVGTLPALEFLHGPLRDQGAAAVDAMKQIVDAAIKASE